MATVYLPVQPIEGMDSAERAEALDAETWRLRRPLSLQSPQDVTKYYYHASPTRRRDRWPS